MEKTELAERWTNLLKPMFPRSAWFERQVSNKYIQIEIGWTLMNDPSRPSKPSRSIQVKLSEETIETSRDVLDADRRIRDYVSRRLRHFDPDHNTPRNMDPPVEEWRIDL